MVFVHTIYVYNVRLSDLCVSLQVKTLILLLVKLENCNCLIQTAHQSTKYKERHKILKKKLYNYKLYNQKHIICLGRLKSVSVIHYIWQEILYRKGYFK